MLPPDSRQEELVQTAALAFRPALALTVAGTQTWENGVVHTDGSADVYELPSQTPGVPQRIEVRPVLWGLLGKEVTATDCQGKPLQATRDSSGLVTRDPRSGLESVLDPKARTITVSTPVVREKLEDKNNFQRDSYHREARQEVDGQGNCRYVSNLHGESEAVMISMVREMPPNQRCVTRDSKSWEETTLAPGRAPETRRLSSEQHTRPCQDATLSSSLSLDGKLVVVGDDGITRSYEMFLKV